MTRAHWTPAAETIVKSEAGGTTINEGWIPSTFGRMHVVADTSAMTTLTSEWNTSQKGRFIYVDASDELYIWDGAAADVVGAGSGGGGILSDTLAGRPAAGTAGRLYLATDADTLYYDDGAAWKSWKLLYPTAEFVDGDFSWLNQGSATMDSSKGSPTLFVPGSGGHQVRGRVKTVPSAPYSVTIGVIVTALQDRTTYAPEGGLVLRESGSQELKTFGYCPGTGELLICEWTDHDTLATPSPEIFFLTAAPTLWLRIRDDNTNRHFEVSLDGFHFITVLTEGRTVFLTPDQIGVYGSCGDQSQPTYVTINGWAQA